MRRLAISLLPVLLLAACAGAPQKTSRGSGGIVAANGASHTPPPGFPHFVDHSIGREEISIQAMSLVGVPYRWGGNTPDSGFDCSGLVRYVVLRAASVNLPRTTAEMSGRGESIEPDEIAPGDLIFFNTTGRAHSHVGIYVGKLRFVNAPSTGGTVRLDYLTNPYWAKRFDGIRRMAGPTATPAPFDTPSYQAAAPQTERGVAATAAGTGTIVAVPATSAYAGAPPTATAQRVTDATTAADASGDAPVAQADQFEPPPGLGTAQWQARPAGAAAPAVVPVARGSTHENGASSPIQSMQPATTARALPPAAPDAINAAADAFEPPPPASVAQRQARQAQQIDDTVGGVRLMRASTASHGMPAPTQSGDDPIARFANGNY
ncbi:NlpC/P60 family protein [Paraburkholderia sp. MMS20-SJTN17]|uniref:NlpC/P60 family protein n=1 Tax=Paraburkholderia translucens TaxID=2886945 RepID=A0ABS8KAE1_9BURK|nr:C40 family peptidase [Paraburkholderia sp. MMS20-SJTN17]MCC8401698.1 NlpC/P60 family protein [Paraburkholderia sp. MMS20-SJTN17]